MRMPRPIVEKPKQRSLWIYTIDPSLALKMSSVGVSETTINVSWDDLEEKSFGIVGEYVEVVDFDPTVNAFYEHANLNNPYLLVSHGFRPTESDPRFHQQMTYAVVMRTIRTFETVLGRPVLWSRYRPTGSVKSNYVDKLRIYPHALRQANAYYDPKSKALLFGYFPTEEWGAGMQSRGNVFTALSFDIISHETTHAILDGIHPKFIEDTNPDAAAFHEAFADIVALFQHFSVPSLLRHVIGASRGNLASDNPLAQLAVQFGQGTGSYGALRDAIGVIDSEGKWHRKRPSDFDIDKATEPHARGAILVSAVFDAFLNIYENRTADLMRIATGGTGILPLGQIHPDLVGRLADEAEKAAKHVLAMCIRALDYMPPVDPTFGEFLRAVITADIDVAPTDPRNYRTAFIEAFRPWKLIPEGVGSMGVDALRWQQLGGLISNEELQSLDTLWFEQFRELMKSYALVSREIQASRTNSDLKVALKKVYKRAEDQPDVESRRHAVDQCMSFYKQQLNHKFRDFKVKRDSADEIKDQFFRDVFGFENPKRMKVEIHSIRQTYKPNAEDGIPETDDIVIVAMQKRIVDTISLEDINTVATIPAQSNEKVWTEDEISSRLRDGSAMIFRGGSTMIYDLRTGVFRYVIRKNLLSHQRRQKQAKYQSGNFQSLYFEDDHDQPFRALHEVQL